MPNETILSDQTPRTISVEEAGRVYFGLTRNAAYDAVKRGDIPVIRLGKRMRVPVRAMENRLAAVE